MNLTYLDISSCQLSRNQEFIDLMFSPNLPNLTTLKGKALWAEEDGKEKDIVVEIPPNSQSSLTDLDIRYCRVGFYPSLFNHCPKLKKLSVYSLHDEESKKLHLNMMKSPNLTNLEYLKMDSWNEASEIIFTNPIYSNLKELHLVRPFRNGENLNVELVSNCNNLVNLTTLTVSVETQDLQEFQKNPTFSKLKRISNIVIPQKRL